MCSAPFLTKGPLQTQNRLYRPDEVGCMGAADVQTGLTGISAHAVSLTGVGKPFEGQLLCSDSDVSR